MVDRRLRRRPYRIAMLAAARSAEDMTDLDALAGLVGYAAAVTIVTLRRAIVSTLTAMTVGAALMSSSRCWSSVRVGDRPAGDHWAHQMGLERSRTHGRPAQ